MLDLELVVCSTVMVRCRYFWIYCLLWMAFQFKVSLAYHYNHILRSDNMSTPLLFVMHGKPHYWFYTLVATRSCCVFMATFCISDSLFGKHRRLYSFLWTFVSLVSEFARVLLEGNN